MSSLSQPEVMSYDDERLARQLAGWADAGIPRVKIKVGRDLERDPHRIGVAREAIGDEAELMVDANGAYRRQEALLSAERFAGAGLRSAMTSSTSMPERRRLLGLCRLF